MKVSEITLEVIQVFLRVTEDDGGLIETLFLPAAKRHLMEYTGLTEEQMEEKEDLALACLVLVSHFYDNRSMVVDGDKVNQVLDSLIFKYSQNLVG